MYIYNKPDINVFINDGIDNLEQMVGVKLNDEQVAIYIMGFGSGLTTAKNFPEYNESLISDLWVSFKKSTCLNAKVKEWADNFVSK